MSRSLKKGPYTTLWDTLLLFITETNLFLFTLLRIW